MELSARNRFKGQITSIVTGLVNAEVTIAIAPGIEMVSVITKSSAERLGLTEGQQVYAVVKSTDVMVGKA